jgi:hypothetical protein
MTGGVNGSGRKGVNNYDGVETSQRIGPRLIEIGLVWVYNA